MNSIILDRVLIAGVISYRRSLGRILPPACRFQPSCSGYAIEAIEKHGALKGSLLALKRLGRCHPFHQGGYDPVP
jgi:putative membrane protein insertion efficiency factor